MTLRACLIPVLALLVLASAFASPATAEDLFYDITLSTSDVVPPPSTPLTGAAVLTLEVDALRISGDVVVPIAQDYEVHLHLGPAGENGPRFGTFDLISPTFGDLDLDQTALDAIYAGEAYLEVTLVGDDAGIVRGQFPPLAVPGDESSMGRLKAEMLAVR